VLAITTPTARIQFFPLLLQLAVERVAFMARRLVVMVVLAVENQKAVVLEALRLRVKVMTAALEHSFMAAAAAALVQ
jgi:hypothetical protein